MSEEYDYISEVNRSIDALSNHGLILYPTDTIWGLGCDATDEQAVSQVFNVKKRPENKSCIILFPTLREALKYSANPPEIIYSLYDEYRSIPTTFIIEHAIGLAHGAIHSDDTMAFRVPQHRFCTQLLKKYGKPIISTSANVSGEPSPAFYHDISDDIKNSVDYIVDSEMPDTSTHAPSKIIRVFQDNSIEIIR